jgi:hypothetical protein
MKKLGALVVMGGALAAGLPGPASAQTAAVTIQCTTFFGTPPAETIFGVDASTGFTPPTPACNTGSSCAGCVSAIQALPADGAGFIFNTVVVTGISQAITGYAGPYFLLTRLR